VSNTVGSIRQTWAGCAGGAGGLQHASEGFGLRVSQVDRQRRGARDRRQETGFQPQLAGGRDAALRVGDPLDRQHRLGRGQAGVAAHRHRRGPGMGGLAAEGEARALDPGAASDRRRP
jgi:hypothetical protein